MRTGLLAVGAVVVLAGCGATTVAAPTSAPSASPILPVKNPRDVAALARRPCELLTAQQAKEFGLGVPPRQYDAGLGDVGCEWETTARDQALIRKVNISTFTNNPTLEVVYSKDRNLPFFALTEIANYPAIITRTNADIPICDIDVKPAERQSFTLTYEALDLRNNPQQSCEVGKQVAAAVLMNFPLKS
ncbi:MAG TPA: DUF3558 domain-containing protein [Pseudonocardiaceae bacterium]|nr:DUF3558 domain-containing protein [Pseudonocardiaceae bacterium]